MATAWQPPWPGVPSGSLGGVFDGKFRAPIDKAVKPIGDGLRRTKLTPDHLTIAGLVLGVGAAFAIGPATCRSGCCSWCWRRCPTSSTAPSPRRRASASQRGAFFDSTVDRITDALLFGGVAWYLASEYSAHMALLPFAVHGVRRR